MRYSGTCHAEAAVRWRRHDGKEMNGALKTLEPLVTRKETELSQNCAGDEHDLSEGTRMAGRKESTFSAPNKRYVQLPRNKGRIVRRRCRQPRPVASGRRLAALGFPNGTYQDYGKS